MSILQGIYAPCGPVISPVLVRYCACKQQDTTRSAIFPAAVVYSKDVMIKKVQYRHIKGKKNSQLQY